MSANLQKFKCYACGDPCTVVVKEWDGSPSYCLYGITSAPCRWDIVTTTVESQLTEIKWEGKDTMFTVMGQPYRCECGCNVFRYNIKHTQAKCNACNTVYSTER